MTSPTQDEPLLRWFGFEHLPPDLAAISQPFFELAHLVVDALPRTAERSACLRKLVEAKYCAIRAALEKRG